MSKHPNPPVWMIKPANISPDPRNWNCRRCCQFFETRHHLDDGSDFRQAPIRKDKKIRNIFVNRPLRFNHRVSSSDSAPAMPCFPCIRVEPGNVAIGMVLIRHSPGVTRPDRLSSTRMAGSAIKEQSNDLRHDQKEESCSGNQIAADERTLEDIGRTASLLPLLPMLPRLVAVTGRNPGHAAVLARSRTRDSTSATDFARRTHELGRSPGERVGRSESQMFNAQRLCLQSLRKRS